MMCWIRARAMEQEKDQSIDQTIKKTPYHHQHSYSTTQNHSVKPSCSVAFTYINETSLLFELCGYMGAFMTHSHFRFSKGDLIGEWRVIVVVGLVVSSQKRPSALSFAIESFFLTLLVKGRPSLANEDEFLLGVGGTVKDHHCWGSRWYVLTCGGV